MARGGPLQEVSIHGRKFQATGDASISLKLGGAENDPQSNGDGATGRYLQTLVPWSANGGQLVLDSTRGDQEYLQEIADNARSGAIKVTLRNGDSYQGEGSVTGEIASDTATVSGPINLGGFGKLTKQ